MYKLLRPYTWFTLALVALLLVGFACGDDDDDDDDEETTAAASPTDGESPTEDGGAPGEVETDVGVSETEIKLGQHIVLSGNLAAVYQPMRPPSPPTSTTSTAKEAFAIATSR